MIIYLMNTEKLTLDMKLSYKLIELGAGYFQFYQISR